MANFDIIEDANLQGQDDDGDVYVEDCESVQDEDLNVSTVPDPIIVRGVGQLTL